MIVLTMNRCEQVQAMANSELDRIYEEMEWPTPREHKLSPGEVRAVIEAWEKVRPQQSKREQQ